MNDNKNKAIIAKLTTAKKSHDVLNGYTIIGEYKSTKTQHIQIENASINAVLNITKDSSAIYDVFSNDDILINNQTIKIEPLKWYNLESNTNIQFGNVKYFFDKDDLDMITVSDGESFSFIEDDVIPCTQPDVLSENTRSRKRNGRVCKDSSPLSFISEITISRDTKQIQFEDVPETEIDDYAEDIFIEDDDIEIPETQLPKNNLTFDNEESSNDTIIFHLENDMGSTMQSQSQVVVSLKKPTSNEVENKNSSLENNVNGDFVNENDANFNDYIIHNNCNNVPRISSVRSLSRNKNPILNFNDRSGSVTPDLIFDEEIVVEESILVNNNNRTTNDELKETSKLQTYDLINTNNIRDEDMPDTQLFFLPQSKVNNGIMAPPSTMVVQKKNNISDVDPIYEQQTQVFQINKLTSTGIFDNIEPEENLSDYLTQKFIPSRSKTPDSDKKSSDHDDIYNQMKQIFESPKRINSPSINSTCKRKHGVLQSESDGKLSCENCIILVKRVKLNDVEHINLDDTVPFNYLQTPNIKQMCEKLKDSILENKHKNTINFLNNNFNKSPDSKVKTIKDSKKEAVISSPPAKRISKTKISSIEKNKKTKSADLSNSFEYVNDTKKSLRVKKNSDSFSNMTSSFDSTCTTRSLRVKFCILFTKIKSETYQGIIKHLGGRIVQKIEEATILVSPEANSTCKFLSAVGKGIPIVSPKWLDDSKKAKEFLDSSEYILSNQKNEKTYKYSIKNTIAKSSLDRILNGFKVFSTPNMEIIPNDIETIVTMCGGEYFKNIKKYETSIVSKTESFKKDKIIVVSVKADKSIWHQYKVLCKKVYIIDKDKFKTIILQHDINHIYKEINV